MRDNQNYYIKGDFITRGHSKQKTLLKNDLLNHAQYFFISLFIPLIIFGNRLFNKTTKKL